MDKTQALIDGYEAIQQFLRENNYSEDTKARYRSAYEKLSEYYITKKQDCYDRHLNEKFRDKIISDIEKKRIPRKRGRRMVRVSIMIDDYYGGKPFQLRHSYGNRHKYKLEPFYQEWADRFRDSLEVGENTIPTFYYGARTFLHFLQNRNIKDFSLVDIGIITGYLIEKSVTIKGGMGNIMCSLRKLLSFLKVSGFSGISDNFLPFKTAPSRRRIYPAFTQSDMNDVLNSPDANTAMGKRDFA
ncbi:MAG: hypothetical protein LBV07_01615, partial [Syntrophobacterales bacterium]|nr:hypothetical protein [Syntrophobacterales bacterium]